MAIPHCCLLLARPWPRSDRSQEELSELHTQDRVALTMMKMFLSSPLSKVNNTPITAPPCEARECALLRSGHADAMGHMQGEEEKLGSVPNLNPCLSTVAEGAVALEVLVRGVAILNACNTRPPSAAWY